MKKQNFYNTFEETIEHRKYEGVKNPRYPNFNQTHFTVGDEEQFQHSTRDKKKIEDLVDNDTLYKDKVVIERCNSKLFNRVDGLTVTNTFNYLFHKFKKGVYVKIENGELVYFLPFSKYKFINEIKNICVNSRWKNFEELVEYCQKIENRRFNPKNIGKFSNYWYFNNFLIRYEYPVTEEDSGTTQMKDMLNELCKNRKIQDIEFFLNRRDFPFLKRDLTESYSSLFDDNTSLVSYTYNKHIPILSMCVT